MNRTMARMSMLAFVACDGTDTEGAATGDTAGTPTDPEDTAGGGADTAPDGATGTSTGGVADCTSPASHADEVVCVVTAFLDGLDATQRATASYAMTDSADKTLWSNLPGVDRAGIALGDLDATGRADAMAVAAVLLSEEGLADLDGILAADDYLGTVGGGGGGGPGGGGGYSSDLAHIAVFGTPSTTSDFMVMIGNHHMAFNVTYRAGVGYPVPHHAGVEPKGSFTVDSETYAPLDDDGAAMIAVFDSLDASQRASAYLSGQVFGDVMLGPVEFGTGRLDAVVYPTQEGLLVTDLDADQQALVTEAIAHWVGTFAEATSDALIEAYVADYASTTVSFAGASSGPDLDVNGSYMRIDGPRVWIEVAMQNGVILSGTHYHTIYRDKEFDYGGVL